MSPAKDIRVSVVIPMYYAEKFADDLLGRLRTQSLEEIEVICVVDGSPDGTLDIVKRHAEIDSRVRWLYQENAGAGAARNAGMELASGEYLAFLDADDLYDPQMLSRMYNAAVAHDADLAVCQFTRVDYKTNKVKHNQDYRHNNVPIGTALSPLDLENPFKDISVVPQNKFFKKEMVKRESLRFSPTISNNDYYFVFCSIASSKRIVAIADDFVEVRKYANLHSISSNRAKHTEDMFGNYRDLRDWLVQRDVFQQYRETYIQAWTSSFHYNATYERNELFIEFAAKTLACEEPWVSMSNRELVQAARLDTSLASIRKRRAARKANTGIRDIELQRLENEVETVSDVARLLNFKYGKHLPEKPSVLRGGAAYLSHLSIWRRIGKPRWGNKK